MDKNRISFAMHVLHFTATPKRHGLIKAKHGDWQHLMAPVAVSTWPFTVVEGCRRPTLLVFVLPSPELCSPLL